MDKLYVCLECEALFDQPKRYVEQHGLDDPPYETRLGCPVCGGVYVPLARCSWCRRPITGDYVEIDATGEKYCDNCISLKTV